MNPEDRIDEWARARADAHVPDGFADRVVAAASAATEARTPRLLRAAALTLAAAGGLLRIAAALAIFSSSCAVMR